MSERVPVVQEQPPPAARLTGGSGGGLSPAATRGVALIGGYGGGLDPDASRHQRLERGRVTRERRRGISLQPVEQRGIQREAVLGDLGQTRAEVTIGQRGKRLDVAQDGERLMEGAHEVLAL